MRWLILLLLLLVSGLVFADWDYRNSLIDPDEIISGGPPKNGIPALIDPHFVAASEADYMRADELVLGVAINGVARAYPTRILSWHELVNDHFRDLPVLVSW